MTQAPFGELGGRIAVFDEHGHALPPERVDVFVWPACDAAQVSALFEFGKAFLGAFVGPPTEGGQVFDRRKSQLVDVLQDSEITRNELEASCRRHGSVS